MKVIITIPAYNEEETIVETINDINTAMEGSGYDYTIHVRDDGSEDKTYEVAEAAGAISTRNKANLGLAKTFVEEVKVCANMHADIIVHTDADNQYRAEYIPKLIKAIEDGADLVLGSRFKSQNKYTGSIIKKALNPLFSMFMSTLVGMKVSDATTGFRAFKVKAGSFPIISRFTYTHEQIIRAKRLGMVIREVQVETNETRKSRLFKNPLDYAIKSIVNIVRLYRDFDPIKFFGQIGIATIIPGMVLGTYTTIAYIMYGPGKLTKFALASLFFCLAGLQIALFGLLADMNRKD